MGCELSHAVSVDNKPDMRPCHALEAHSGTLTDYHKDVIGSTWPILCKNRIERGCSVFIDIFNAEPQVEKLFSFQFKEQEQRLSNESFRHHSTIFMDTVASVCDNLDNFDVESEISKRLMLLGAHHATISGYDPLYFDIFAKCLHLTWEAVLGEEYTEDVRGAWTLVFCFITHRMQDGYKVYMQEIAKERRADEQRLRARKNKRLAPLIK